MCAARDARVHARAAHLLQAHPLTDHHLGHARRAQIHRSVALAHDHHVAECRYVGAAGSAGPEQHAHLRNHARQAHLVVEDSARAAAAREHLHLLGYARARRVDQVHQWCAQGQRSLLHAQDLLHRLRPPRAGLDRGIVGHQRDWPAIERAHAGHHPLGAEPILLPAG